MRDEDQEDDSLGNIFIALVSADERKPRLVLVCSEETNWFTRPEKIVNNRTIHDYRDITADDYFCQCMGSTKLGRV